MPGGEDSGIRGSKEDPEEFMEPFIEFCKEEGLLKSECEDEWEKDILFFISFFNYESK